MFWYHVTCLVLSLTSFIFCILHHDPDPRFYRRKSISGSWKANIGSSVLEQIPITDRYKKWLDEVSNIFGGLDILVLEAVADREGREIIYEVSGSQMSLMGETQEEDRKLIADLLCNKMSLALA